MTSRNYDVILTVTSAANFRNGMVLVGNTTRTSGIIANVDTTLNTLKVKIANTLAEYISGESVHSNVIITSGGSNPSINTSPYLANAYSSHSMQAVSSISAITNSKYIREKNAFEQKPLVRLYTVYYPGEWYPANSNGNPTGDGAGYAWPTGFPFRFAEIRGDIISDLQYAVKFGNVNYTPYPIDSTGIDIDSTGKVNEVSISISNWDNLITQLVENPNLVGNNTSNANVALVNGELVGNIDPRTVPGHSLFDQSVVDSRGGTNLAFDYSSTQDVNGSWQRLKMDTRDLLGAVVEIRSTFATFLDYWPEHSTIRGLLGNTIELYTTGPYRIGDNVCTNANIVQATVTAIEGNLLMVNANTFDGRVGDKLYIINPDASSDDYVLDKFKINSLDVLDDKVAKFSLTSWLQYFKLQLPKRKFFKNVCPWPYKGPECQYPASGSGVIPGTTLGGLFSGQSFYTANGFFMANNVATLNASLDECAHNLEACQLRNNQVHFGGFPGTGRTIPS